MWVIFDGERWRIVAQDWQGIFTSNLLTVLYMCRPPCAYAQSALGPIINLGAVVRARIRAGVKFQPKPRQGAVVALSVLWRLKEAKNDTVTS